MRAQANELQFILQPPVSLIKIVSDNKHVR